MELKRLVQGFEKKDELSGYLENLKALIEALEVMCEKWKSLARMMELKKSLSEIAAENALTTTNKVPDESEVSANGEDAEIQRENDNLVVEEKVNDKFEDEIHEDKINPENDAVPKLQMNDVNLECFNQHFKPTYRWVLGGLEKELKEFQDRDRPIKFEMLSQEFAWAGYPTMRSRAKLEFKEDGSVVVSLDIAESSKKNLSRENFKLLPEIYYVLRFKNRKGAFPIRSCESNSYCFREERDFASLNFWEEFDKDESFFSKYFSRRRANGEDAVVVIEVYVAPPAQTEKLYSYDGSLINVALRNLYDFLPPPNPTVAKYFGHDAIYLYTAPRGYRVQVCLEKGPDDDIFKAVILFVLGEFDRELIKFFNHRTSVTLVHSSRNAEKNVVKVVEKFINIEDIWMYTINMCEWSELRHFIHDDGSLRFHLAIEAI